MSPIRQTTEQKLKPTTSSSVHYGAGQPAKRQAIIGAAQRVFLRNGFAETSVDAIAAEARVSKQTIYNHFGDKENLFSKIIETAQKSANPGAELKLEEKLASSKNLGKDLRLLGRQWVRAALAEDVVALRRLVIAESSRHPHLLGDWTQRRPQIEQALSRAISMNQTLNVPDADLAAHQLLLLVVVEALTRSLYGLRKLSSAEVDEIVDSGVEMWLRCYRAAPMQGK